MRLLGRDPNSLNGSSPTIWDNGDSYVIQGWKIADTAVLEEIGEVPDHEAVIEIPKRMMPFFPEAAGA